MLKPEPLFFTKVYVDLHWGFASRYIILSKSRESFLIPPPTTLIGALAYSHAKLLHMPEELASLSYAENIRKNIVSVNVKVNSPLQSYSDLSKIWWYKKRERTPKFDAVATGKVVKGVAEAPSFTVVYLFNYEGLRNLGGERSVVTSSLSIARIGGREGLASVKKLEFGQAKQLESKRTSTNYSFWHDLAGKLIGNYYAQRVVDYRKVSIGDYSGAPTRLHVYPYDVKERCATTVEVEIEEGDAVIYDVGGESVIVEL